MSDTLGAVESLGFLTPGSSNNNVYLLQKLRTLSRSAREGLASRLNFPLSEAYSTLSSVDRAPWRSEGMGGAVRGFGVFGS